VQEMKKAGYTVAEQIDVQKTQINHMERSLANARKTGAISQEHADHRMGCARATLKTLEQLRALVRGEEIEK